MSRVPPVVASPPVLRSDWKILTRLASRRSKPLDFNTCLASSSLHQFCRAIDKPKSAWFWASNKKTVTVILRHKSSNRSYRFWGPNRKILRTWFWSSTKKLVLLISMSTVPEINKRKIVQHTFHHRFLNMLCHIKPYTLLTCIQTDYESIKKWQIVLYPNNLEWGAEVAVHWIMGGRWSGI
jgi:hypothetical protein